MRDGQQSRLPFRGGSPRGQTADGSFLSGDHGLARGIETDNRKRFTVQHRLNFFPRRGNGEHRAGRTAEFRHRRAAHARDPQQRGFVKRARPVQRRDFAEAVADGGGGADAEFFQHFQRRQRRGHDGGLHHARRNGIAIHRQRGPRVTFTNRLEAPTPHPAIEMHRRSLAGKKKRDARRRVSRAQKNSVRKFQPRRDARLQPRLQRLQPRREFRRFRRDDRRAHRPGCQGVLQLRCEVGQFRPRNSGGDGQKVFDLLREFLRCRRAEQKQFGILSGAGQRAFTRSECSASFRDRAFENKVRVDAAETHRADAGSERAIFGPEFGLAQHTQRGRGAAKLRVRLIAAGRGRQHLRVYGHRGLDQTRETRRRLGVADVGLDRTNDRQRRIGFRFTSRAREHFEFRGVADRRAGAVSFAIRNGVDAETRAPIRAPHGFELSVRLGPRDAAAAVGGNSPAADDRIHAAALRQRIFVTHERDKSAAFARPESRRAPVEDAHFIGGQRAGFGKADQFKRVEAEIDATRERDIEITGGERGTGIRDREQGRGARAIDGVTAALQIELIADAPGDGVGETAGEGFFAQRREG